MDMNLNMLNKADSVFCHGILVLWPLLQLYTHYMSGVLV